MTRSSEILQATEYFPPLKMVVTEVPNNKVFRLKSILTSSEQELGFCLTHDQQKPGVQ